MYDLLFTLIVYFLIILVCIWIAVHGQINNQFSQLKLLFNLGQVLSNSWIILCTYTRFITELENETSAPLHFILTVIYLLFLYSIYELTYHISIKVLSIMGFLYMQTWCCCRTYRPNVEFAAV